MEGEADIKLDGKTDMTRFMEALRNCVKAPKMEHGVNCYS